MSRLRRLREGAGLTQGELARRAGVSRQLVGAVETGRHLPRVDAAMGLATALGVSVDDLFAEDAGPVDALDGSRPPDGTLVRVAEVGDVVVTARARLGNDGFDVADAVVEHGALTRLTGTRPALAVAGCEPGLPVLERLLRERGLGGLSAAGSSATALDALRSGRLHAAVVHGPGDRPLPGSDLPVDRIHVARWRVGLAGPPDASSDWWRRALSGREPVIQREQGAGVQRAFLQALGRSVASVPGPVVGGHLEAARRTMVTGMASVTIEPAAAVVGAVFRPIETHRAELWIDRRWRGHPPVVAALEVLTSRRFLARLSAAGGYDLADIGTLVA